MAGASNLVALAIAMSEPNPYEPPREPEPLTTGKVVKGTVGVGAIILLTPPAIAVAAASSCGVTLYARPSSLFIVPVISIAFPSIVLFGLMTWAITVDRRERGNSNRNSRRAALLATVAPIFLLAQILGFVLAVGAFVAVNESLGVGIFPGLVAGWVICWLVPAVTLLFLLCRVWLIG